jgi:hypothetical protein
MTQFKAIDPNVEVSGAAVLSVIEGMTRCSDCDLMESFRKMATRILTKNGIENPQHDKWYLQQAWLNAFAEIADEIGPATLRMIGEKIPETALWPPEINTIEEGLASIDVAYHMNHRGGEIGHYRFEEVHQTGRRSGRMVCDNPYPCSFDFGIVKATARRFASKDQPPIVTHDDSRPCRQKGADSCTYQILW